MKVVVTTTITVPENIRAWREELEPDDWIIVAGDINAPHKDIEEALAAPGGVNIYLRPHEQMNWECSSIIGWKSIQRRNIAILAAMERLPDMITTIDTDNWPLKHDKPWFSVLTGHHRSHNVVPMFDSSTGIFNPGQLCIPPIMHRGMPFDFRGNPPSVSTEYVQPVDYRIGVHASLWLGDPDVDAIDRIANYQETRSCAMGLVAPGTLAPFNSQSTTWCNSDLFPLMCVWPGVGRMDDIWSSYLARVIMDRLGYHVMYGAPMVRQDRHPHNLVTDLKGEMIGYENTRDLIRILVDIANEVDINTVWTPLEWFSFMTSRLSTWSKIPIQTRDFFTAWVADCEKVGY